MKHLPTECRTHKRERRLLIAVSALVCLLLCILLVRTATWEKAAYAPPPFAENALGGTPALTADDGYGTVTTDFGFSFALCAAPAYDGSQLFLYLTNPKANDAWLMAEILSEDGTESYGKSGIVREDSYLSSFPLETALPAGETFSVRIYAFTPDTYQSEGTVDLGGLSCSETEP